MNVVILGSGNVATVLSAVLDKAGHNIIQVLSRNIANAKQLAEKYNAQPATFSGESFAKADIYIICLTDAALESIDKIKGFREGLVLHTAGSVQMDILKNVSSRYGVLYPLQTLTRDTAHTPKIPFLVGGNTLETTHEITEFASTISDIVIACSDEERLRYHVAAVFVANFTNHLMAMTESFCEKEKIEFKALLPLINEVADKANHFSPLEMQTGPAIREDIVTLNRHLQTLSPHADLKYLYLKISESILKLHQKKNR
ncbi:MAG: Rossmann-like and DUF2520 domain-containing protein [Ginsengibacter sp.]